MQTLTRDELSQLIVGGINMTEGASENGDAVVTYEVLGTNETFVQVVKDSKDHESYQIDPILEEELKVELGNDAKISDLKAKLEAEKLKPIVDFKQIREDKIQAEIAAAKAVQIEDVAAIEVVQ
jgi:hypothetical protein